MVSFRFFFPCLLRCSLAALPLSSCSSSDEPSAPGADPASLSSGTTSTTSTTSTTHATGSGITAASSSGATNSSVASSSASSSGMGTSSMGSGGGGASTGANGNTDTNTASTTTTNSATGTATASTTSSTTDGTTSSATGSGGGETMGATATSTTGGSVTPSDPIGFASLNGGTIGGRDGETVTVSTYAELKSCAESSSPTVIRVEGTISNGSAGGQINVNSNKSIIGVGSTALLSGVGINISSKNNIIVQNLRATLVGASSPGDVNGGDVIGIQGTSRNIWIDHCELYSEDPAVQTDIDRYDGLLDIKHESGFITISYTYFHDHHKGGLVGAADDDLYSDRKITWHHNYYDNVRLRIPMMRGAVGHFFNNYIVGANDATEIRAGTCLRVERNYYEALHYSIYTPSDAPGSAERIENIEVSRTERAYPANCTADIPYSYAEVLITNTEDVKMLVPELAGVGKAQF